MLPPTHIAIGYLLVSISARARATTVGYRELRFIMIGALLPDLIDKPLQLVGVFPEGRALGHSLLIAFPVITCIGLTLSRRCGRKSPALAFGTSYLVHPLADAFHYPLQGTVAVDFEEIAFLVWPLTVDGNTVVNAISVSEFVAHAIESKPVWAATHLPMGPQLDLVLRVLEVGIVIAATILWYRDGCPGLRHVRTVLSRVNPAA